MRRAWLLPLAAALLGACGTLPSPPAPSTGDLLASPTALQVGARRLKVEAAPVLGEQTFRVRVRVHAARPPLPPLTLTGVYVVTGDGVWTAPLEPSEVRRCGARPCLQATGSGEARGLRPGEGVQVVISLRDEAGRTLWLRDAQASIREE